MCNKELLDFFTWVFLKLGMQIWLFVVELVVDAVHDGHQGARSSRRGDKEGHLGVVLVDVGVCRDQRNGKIACTSARS